MIHPHILTMHQSARHFAKTQNELLATVFVKSLADSFVNVYVPIYLLTHGVSLQAVMLYCMVVFGTTFFAAQMALKACQYIGVKKILSLGIGLTALFYWLLHSLIASHTFLLVGAVDGLAIGFYFGAYNQLITRAVVRGREMHNYSFQQIAILVAGVAGPFVGSLFIKQLSFQGLFLVVVGLLCLAPLPLFFSRDFRAKREALHLRTLARGNRAQRRIDRTVFLQGMLYGAGTIWPLYLYIHYPHIVMLGIIASLSAASVVVGTFVAGKFVDTHQRFAYNFGALLYAPTWITRILFVTPLGLAANTFAASFLGVAPTMAVARDIFHSAKLSKNRSAHFTRVEFYMDAGRISVFLVAFCTANLTAMFIVSSLAAFAYLTCVPARRTGRSHQATVSS